MTNLSDYSYSKFLPDTPSIGGTIEPNVDHVHLSFGFPSSELFPIDELNKAASKAILEQGRKALHYSGGPGPKKVREWIANHVSKRDLQVTEKDVLVTVGAGHAIDVTSHVLVNPGEEVWAEAPSFFSALRTFQLAGAHVRTFPIDGQGVQVDLIEAALIEAKEHHKPYPKFIYTMPNFHNPGGINQSVERRQKLAQLALKYNFYILEDDAYADLNFKREPLPSIYSFAPERVIYVGTFSKIIGPGIRLGWAIANQEVLKKMQLFMLGSQTNPFTQEIIAHLLEELSFETYLDGLIDDYEEKRDVMVEALKKNFGDHITFQVPDGGFFLLIEFSEEVDVLQFIPKAFQKGVSVVDGTEFYIDGRGKNQIRLCFTYSSKEQIELGIERLANAYFSYIDELALESV